MSDYNVVVIGGGSAGLISAYMAALLKAKVALIEKKRMGGDCLNTGCVPSKALIRTTRLLAEIKRHREFGIAEAQVNFNFRDVMERVKRVIKTVEPHDSIERYTSLGVECLRGEAKILSPDRVQVGDKVLSTKNIIIATGASPAVPGIPGLDSVDYLDTESVWQLEEQPQRLVIVGGGPIGCELGQSFSRLGCEVTIVDRGGQLLPREDSEAARLLERKLTEEGVRVLLHAEIERIDPLPGGGRLVIKTEKNPSGVDFDRILVAVGRKPRVSGFGLESLGVELDAHGRIAVDAYSRTRYKNIFACGDVTSPYQFTHMAAHQAWYCAVNALARPFKQFKVDASIVPWCTYTDPEVARVGLNETQARENKIPYEVTTYSLEELDRAITNEEAYGFIKVLTVPGKDRILGVTITAHQAGDLLPEFVTACKQGLGLSSILNTIHAYPTLSEANRFVAGAWKKARAPQGLLAILSKFHALRRL